VLRTPKGWTGPKTVDGKPVEGTHRAHQVPLAKLAELGAFIVADPKDPKVDLDTTMVCSTTDPLAATFSIIPTWPTP